MSRRTRELLIWCAATDRTFTSTRVDGFDALVGKCIHCGRALTVWLDPHAEQLATLEHIVPRTHGGTNDLENLAAACKRCNHGKGVRLDARRWGDPTLQRVIETLQRRRRSRYRPAPAGLRLPPSPTEHD